MLSYNHWTPNLSVTADTLKITLVFIMLTNLFMLFPTDSRMKLLYISVYGQDILNSGEVEKINLTPSLSAKFYYHF